MLPLGVAQCTMSTVQKNKNENQIPQTNLYSEAGMTVVLNIIRRQQLPGLQQTPAALLCLRSEFAGPICCKHSLVSVMKCSNYSHLLQTLPSVSDEVQQLF